MVSPDDSSLSKEGKNKIEKCEQNLNWTTGNVVRCPKGCLAEKLGCHCWRILYLSSGYGYILETELPWFVTESQTLRDSLIQKQEKTLVMHSNLIFCSFPLNRQSPWLEYVYLLLKDNNWDYLRQCSFKYFYAQLSSSDFNKARSSTHKLLWTETVWRGLINSFACHPLKWITWTLHVQLHPVNLQEGSKL